MKISKQTLKDILFPIGLTAALGVGVFIGTQNITKAEDSNSFDIPPNQNVPEYAVREFPKNQNGQTYGIAADCAPDNFPDLIGADATNGKQGYVYREHFQGEDMTFTVELKEKLNQRKIYAITVPVYESDGITEIGEFEVSVDASSTFIGTAEEGDKYLEEYIKNKEAREEAKKNGERQSIRIEEFLKIKSTLK